LARVSHTDAPHTAAYPSAPSELNLRKTARQGGNNRGRLHYSKQEEGRERYSPGSFVTVEKAAIPGNPDLKRAGTPQVERKNGSLRQWCKRLTRLTYAFSKKWDNLKAALALHFAYYNFCRVHSSLRVTPAMEAGLTDHVWDLSELIGAS